MATHSRILAWEVLWTREPGRLQSTRLQRVGRDLATKSSLPPAPQQQILELYKEENHRFSFMTAAHEAVVLIFTDLSGRAGRRRKGNSA